MTFPKSILCCLALALVVLVGCGGGGKKDEEAKPKQEAKQDQPKQPSKQPADDPTKKVSKTTKKKEPRNPLKLPPAPIEGDSSLAAYIPASADLVSLSNVQSSLDSPIVKWMPLEVIEVASQKNMGFDFLQVQRVTAWADYQVGNPGPPENAGMILSLLEPLVKSEVLKATSAQEQGNVAGQTTYLAPEFDAYFALPTERTILVSPTGEGLESMLASQDASSRLIEELKATSLGSASVLTLAAAEQLRPELQAMAQQLPLPPELENARKLPDLIDIIRFTVAEEANQIYTLELISPDAESANQLKDLMVTGLNMAQSMTMAQMSQGSNPADPVQQAIIKYYQRILPIVAEGLTPKVDGNQLTIRLESELDLKTIGMAQGVLAAVAIPQVRAAAKRMESANRLKNIILASHNYEARNGKLPENIKDANGKPLLSWRVSILPQVEQLSLYEQIRLDEPWDSPHNKQFHNMLPEVYAHPWYTQAYPKGLTAFLAPIHPGTVYGGESVPAFGQIRDGMSNTIGFVEAPESEAVPWMKPVDLPVDPKNPLQKLLPPERDGFNVAFMDGSVRYLAATIDPEVFASLLTWKGGEVVGEIDY